MRWDEEDTSYKKNDTPVALCNTEHIHKHRITLTHTLTHLLAAGTKLYHSRQPMNPLYKRTRNHIIRIWKNSYLAIQIFTIILHIYT